MAPKAGFMTAKAVRGACGEERKRERAGQMRRARPAPASLQPLTLSILFSHRPTPQIATRQKAKGLQKLRFYCQVRGMCVRVG